MFLMCVSLVTLFHPIFPRVSHFFRSVRSYIHYFHMNHSSDIFDFLHEVINLYWLEFVYSFSPGNLRLRCKAYKTAKMAKNNSLWNKAFFSTITFAETTTNKDHIDSNPEKLHLTLGNSLHESRSISGDQFWG